MCGIIGVTGKSQVNQNLYLGLTMLQHRGQDSAGIATIDVEDRFRIRKANGLVSEVFREEHMLRLEGHIGLGHVRYPTAGSSSVLEAQPFIVNSPYGIALVHNGTLTNAKQLKEKLIHKAKRHINTNSDSELLLNALAYHIGTSTSEKLTDTEVFNAVRKIHLDVKGAYACVAMIAGFGLVAFRDPYGIRPLIYGKRVIDGKEEHMFASESVAMDISGFEVVRDIKPGEAVCVTLDGELTATECAEKTVLAPCLFEYVYFARPDSCIEKVSVYASRVHMGEFLGEKIKRTWTDIDIDVVIPVPETSNDTALRVANKLNKPYRQGFVKNRYVGRTFIMPNQAQRENSVRKKLNVIAAEFKDKNVLLVDDSIVRGTTSKQIVELVRHSGAKKVYLASASPEVRYPNVYGIDMPVAEDLVAYKYSHAEMVKYIGVDGLIFQDLADLKTAVQMENQEIQDFDDSVFTGQYITGDVTEAYLAEVAKLR